MDQEAMIEMLTEAIRQQKKSIDEAEARNAELTGIVEHLSQKLRERDDLIKQLEGELHAFRAQLLTDSPNVRPNVRPVKTVSDSEDKT